MTELQTRETAFKEAVFAHSEYEAMMLDQFFDYWSEANKKGKMRFELEKTWDLKKRLKRWHLNNLNWNHAKRNSTNEQHEQLNNIYSKIRNAVTGS